MEVGDGFNDTVNSMVLDGEGVGGQMFFTDSSLGVATIAMDGNQASLVLGLGLSQGFSPLQSYCTSSDNQTSACEQQTGGLSFFTGFPWSKTSSAQVFQAAYGRVRGSYRESPGDVNITGPYLTVDKPWLISPSFPEGESPSPGALTVVGNTSLYGNFFLKATTMFTEATGAIAFEAATTLSMASGDETDIKASRLQITAPTNITGTLGVSGNTLLDENLEVRGTATVDDAFSAKSSANVGGVLTVTGETTLQSSLSVEGGANVVGSFSAEGEANVAGGNVPAFTFVDLCPFLSTCHPSLLERISSTTYKTTDRFVRRRWS